MTTEVSVIVPTFRRPALLRLCLESLARQDVSASAFEVLVVDDGSGDSTGGVLGEAELRMPNVRAFRKPRNDGPAAARNLGLSRARSPLVLLLDDDIVATPTLISTHLRLQREAADPQLGILGLVKWHPELTVTPFMRWVDRSGLQFAYETWIREGPIAPAYGAFYACNLSTSRAMLEEAGGFDERFPYPAYEDMELAWRMTERGFRLHHAPEALAYHARPIDLPTFRNRVAKVGESAVLLRAVQPGFPLDESIPEAWSQHRVRLWWLRLTGPLARVAGRYPRLERTYRAEISAAYLDGRRRGLRAVAERVAGERRKPSGPEAP
jgi:glycosyltransferase involved in cell wall biosynthesis